MITNEEKIELIINKLNNIQGAINSYITYADLLKDKYSLDEILPEYNSIKYALLQELETLGGSWEESLTNQE